MHNDFTESLFQSVDTIVKARLANLPYDQTIECEIINADNSSQGIYKVKYQNAYFEALSPQSITYSVGDIVYVQVPQNDYKQDKIILNKKKVDLQRKVKTLPFLSFAHNSYANLFSSAQSKKEISIQTTADGQLTTETVPINLLTRETYIVGYTRLGLKFSVSADIKHQLSSGNYGVKIIAKGYDQSKITYEQNYAEDNIKDTFEFNCDIKDMIGSNLYNTLGYCNQEKVFDITNKVITSITIYLYQDGNFKTIDDIAVIGKIIKFTNFQLFTGYEISDFSYNKPIFKLYTGDGLSYSNEYRQKTIYARKCTLTNSTELDIEDIDIEKYEKIYWEQYDANNSEISINSNLLGYTTIEELNNTYPAKVTLSSSRLNKYQSFIGIFKLKTAVDLIISEQLQFDNYTYLASSEVLNILTGFQVIPAEENGYNGIYNIYGQDNYTTDQIITQRQHHLILSYHSFTADNNTQGFQLGDKISWTIPANYTMISEPRQGYDYQQVNEIVVNVNSDTNKIESYTITKDITENSEYFYLPYYIKEYYSPQNTNNTIKCEFIHGQDTFTTQQELLFGTSGSQGSEYTIVPYLLLGNERVKAINQSLTSIAIYQLKVDIYDYNNNLLENESFEFAEIIYNNGFDINITENKNIYINIKPENNEADLTIFNGCIKLITQIGGKTIETYFPIPVAKENKYKAINGSTIIVYDITGKKPFYNKNKFQIDIDDRLIHNIVWQIGYIPEEGDTLILDEAELKAWPQIIDNELNLPSILHQKLLSRKMLLICKDNNVVVWTQPLIIISNKYPIGLKHEEPLPVEIEDNTYIKTSMVGEINQNYLPITNEFEDKLSGAFIGKITKNNIEEFGLFGYRYGAQTFCLNENGQVFLNGADETAVSIENALITDCSFSHLTINDDIKIATNFSILNNNEGVLFSISQDGTITFSNNTNISGELTFNNNILLKAPFTSTADISTSGNITANTFIGKVQNYDTTTGNINERLELIKNAIHTINPNIQLW